MGLISQSYNLANPEQKNTAVLRHPFVNPKLMVTICFLDGDLCRVSTLNGKNYAIEKVEVVSHFLCIEKDQYNFISFETIEKLETVRKMKFQPIPEDYIFPIQKCITYERQYEYIFDKLEFKRKKRW